MAEIWLEKVVKRQFVGLLFFWTHFMNFILGLNIHLPLFIIVFITYESGHNEKDFKVLYLLNCLESNLYVTYHGSINVEVV